MIDFYKKYIKYKTKYISYMTGGVVKKNILISCSNIGNRNDAFIFRNYLHQLLVNMYNNNTSFYLTFVTGTNKDYEYSTHKLPTDEFEKNTAIMETLGFTIKTVCYLEIYDFLARTTDTFDSLIFLGCNRIHELFQIHYFDSFLTLLYNKINDFFVICEFLATYEHEIPSNITTTYDVVTQKKVPDLTNKSIKSIKEFNTFARGNIFDDTIIEDIDNIFQLYFEYLPTSKYYRRQQEQPTIVPLLKNNPLINIKKQIITNYYRKGIFNFDTTKNYLTSLRYNGEPINLNMNSSLDKLRFHESTLDKDTISKIMELLKNYF